MNKKKLIRLFGLSFFSLGIIFLLNAGLNFTGAFISEGLFAHSFGFIIGIVFLILGIIIFSTSSLTLDNRVVNLYDSINENSSLSRLAKKAVRDESIKRDVNHLIQQLSFGNFQAGLGSKHLIGTPCSCARGKNGGRVFYERVGEKGYKIVAESSKDNEQQIINKLREIYKHKEYGAA